MGEVNKKEKIARTYRIDAVWMRKRSSQFISIEMSIVFRRCFCVCGGGGDPLCTCFLCVNGGRTSDAVCNGAIAIHTIVLFDAPTISMKTARNTVKPAYRPNRIAWRWWNFIYILKTLFECVPLSWFARPTRHRDLVWFWFGIFFFLPFSCLSVSHSVCIIFMLL